MRQLNVLRQTPTFSSVLIRGGLALQTGPG